MAQTRSSARCRGISKNNPRMLIQGFLSFHLAKTIKKRVDCLEGCAMKSLQHPDRRKPKPNDTDILNVSDQLGDLNRNP
jgi:hypothetical protein